MAKALDAFRTISEVADDLGIQKHVLRFWEVKFSQIRPMKRGGGRRYYRPEDMELLRGIRQLLHKDGYTIKGVQKILREQGVDAVKSRAQPEGVDQATAASPVVTAREGASAAARKRRGRQPAPGPVSTKDALTAIIAELTAVRAMLQSEPPAMMRAGAAAADAKTAVPAAKSAAPRRARRTA